MNIPVINPSSATIRIMFPALPLQKNTLTAFYSAIVKDDEGYTSFNLQPSGGARMGKNDGSYIQLETDKVLVHDVIQGLGATVATEPFAVAKERIAGVFKRVFAHISPQRFGTNVKLIAHVETNQPDGAVKSIGAALGANFAAEKVEYHLGQKLTGIGLRISSKKEQPAPFFCDLRVEPLFRDLSKIYVDLDVQYDGPTNTLADLEKQIDGVAAYLKGNVKELLSSL
jgi:hypothetical protein